MAVQEDLSEWEIAPTSKMISYALGYVIINYFLYGGFALVFYFWEVEVGLSVIYVGLAFVVFAIWNMVNDPLLGFLTDKPLGWTRKWGMRAPWVVISAFPILIFYFFIWTPPEGASDMTLFIWFIVATCLFDTFFSIFNDHVYGGFTNQFPSEYERRRAFAITTLFLGFGVTGLGIVANMLVVYGDRASFVRLAIIVIIIMVVFALILFRGIGESDEMKEMFIKGYEKAEEKSFMGTMKIALHNKNFATSLAGYTCQITAMSLAAASTIYMYKDVYQLDYAMAAIPSIIGLLAFLGFIPFWSNFARKHGFKRTYWTCFVLHGLSFLPFMWIGMYSSGMTTVLILCIFGFVQSIFYSGEVIMLMPVASDTYDEVSSEVGRRVDATLVGVRTFFFRIAFLVIAVVLTTIHIATAYNPDPYALQTPLAILGIRVHAALIPALIFIIMGFIFRKYYTLEGAEKEALVKKLKDMGIYR